MLFNPPSPRLSLNNNEAVNPAMDLNSCSDSWAPLFSKGGCNPLFDYIYNYDTGGIYIYV